MSDQSADDLGGADLEVGVVVVTYNSVDILDRFLDSVAASTAARLDVTVSDNGSADGTLAVAAGRPEVRIVENGANVGYGRAVNAGVALSKGEFVLVANPDVELEPGALDELLAATERWPRSASLGPLIYTPQGMVYPSARSLPSLGRGTGHAVFGWWWPSNPWTAAYRHERGRVTEAPADWLSGSCLLVRREAFDSVGGFDPTYFMYFEDLDLGERLARGGWLNVYVPTAVVTHLGGHSTSRNRSAMARAHHHSAYQYLSRRYAGGRWLPLRLVLRAGLMARALLASRVRIVAAGAEPQRAADTVPAPPKGAGDGRDHR